MTNTTSDKLLLKNKCNIFVAKKSQKTQASTGFDLQLIYFVDFLLVCSAFNHWQLVEASGNEAMGASFVKGLVGEELFPSYVLTIHSSRAIMVDQVPMTDYSLADSLLHLATTKGKRHEVGAGFIARL